MEEKKGGKNQRPLQIDLNEAPPLTSPRGYGVSDVSFKSGEGGGGDELVCCVCKKGFRGREKVKEWKCFRCLLQNRSGDGGGGCSGVGILDINASPPREAEREGMMFVDLNADVASVRDDRGRDNRGGDTKLQVVCNSSLTSNAPTTNPTWLQRESGYNIQKVSEIVNVIGKLDVEDAVHLPLYSGRNSGNEGTSFQESCLDSTPLDCHVQRPAEVYLQVLREYISRKGGVLGDGWHVEFKFCHDRCKTFAVYYAADGCWFESMSDVARHLGLQLSCPYEEAEHRDDEYASVHQESHNHARRQGTSAFFKGQNVTGNISERSSPSSFRSDSGRNTQELGCLESRGSGYDWLHDNFPVQFEDFYLISTGNVDARPSYHNTNQIWPVGYKSSWHDKLTGSLFECEIVDGGESGPIFRVQRYSCTTQSLPIGSTVLSRAKLAYPNGDDKQLRDYYGEMNDEYLSLEMMLTASIPPYLDIENSAMTGGDEGKANFLPPEILRLSTKSADTFSGFLAPRDYIGEFLVEARSSSSAWEMVAQTISQACLEAYKQEGKIQFYCNHGVCAMNAKDKESLDSLSKFSHCNGSTEIPDIIQSEAEFNITCEVLMKWLQHDRFGLDAKFVQEIIEKLPGVGLCSNYKCLDKREPNSILETVEGGFLKAKRKSNIILDRDLDGLFRCSKRRRPHFEDTVSRASHPQGKPLSSKLPAHLVGDALQAWEFSWRFSEVLGLRVFPFQELELELVNPWLDCQYSREKHLNEVLDSEHVNFLTSESDKIEDRISRNTRSRGTGIILTDIHGSLLEVLVGELLSKVAAYVDPNFEAGEPKPRRGRKRDADYSVAAKKKLVLLPVNEFTWPEIARRYLLTVFSMEGKLDSAEIASRESGKVFHCLRGDGGILCGSLTGVAAMEADALLLAEATKQIYGSLRSKSESLSIDQKEGNAVGASNMTEEKLGVVPEWAQVLEPVRKLPTNVGARIRKCVHEALAKNPPEWAKIKLEQSISKEVYKGNASGPTKRAVVAVLDAVICETPSQKPEKKGKVKSVNSVPDLVMKQCRIVLRLTIAADEDRVFCNLLGRTTLNPNDNDEDGLLGYPAMVSRPLDFRTIDLRLATGAYGGSHEAFFDDVQEVWHTIRTAYGDQSDLVDLAETLSKKFKDLYEKEVLTLVQKTIECAKSNCSNDEAIRERDNLLVHASENSLPKAPWDDGICKICGLDRDDDNVLLCDTCDSEYHTYCLNPPLVRIPDGNWYCPSCIAAQSTSQGAPNKVLVANRCRKKRYQGGYTQKFLEVLVKITNAMELKDYWELTVEERITLMKVLCDESLNLAMVREHVDQCASRSTDLQQKLRTTISEWKNLKFKEDMLTANLPKANSVICNGGGELRSAIDIDVRSTNQIMKKTSDTDQLQLEDQIECNTNSSGNVLNEHVPSSPVTSTLFSDYQSCDANLSEAEKLELSILKNKISNMQDVITTLEAEVSKLSLRKEFLGRDSDGRLYWVFGRPGASPWILVNGNLSAREVSKNLFPYGREDSTCIGTSAFSNPVVCELMTGDPQFNSWICYQSDVEIRELIEWLRDDDVRERELKQCIQQWKSSDFRDFNSSETSKQIRRAEGELLRPNCINNSDSIVVFTRALTVLSNKFGPSSDMGASDLLKNFGSKVTYEGGICRCECLEAVWPARFHCVSCHCTYSSEDELTQHSDSICKTASSWQTGQNPSESKKVTSGETTLEKRSGSLSTVKASNEMHENESGFGGHRFKSDCPFRFEEIRGRYANQMSIKELVKEIGLIGSNGKPTFAPSSSPCYDDPALMLVSATDDDARSGDLASALDNSHDQLSSDSSHVAPGISHKNLFDNPARWSENSCGERETAQDVVPMTMIEQDVFSYRKHKSPPFGISLSRIVHQSSLRPLVGRASDILRQLKINLLDMDAALPGKAVRASRSNPERRRAWRAFVKSASTIYQVVQAIIIFEDTIRTEFLKSDWWYWSSPSAAARISTLSALALRIYSLDSAILYEKTSSNDDLSENVEKEDCKTENGATPDGVDNMKPGSPQMQKMLDLDPQESSRPKTRTSKRRKDSGG